MQSMLLSVKYDDDMLVYYKITPATNNELISKTLCSNNNDDEIRFNKGQDRPVEIEWDSYENGDDDEVEYRRFHMRATLTPVDNADSYDEMFKDDLEQFNVYGFTIVDITKPIRVKLTP